MVDHSRPGCGANTAVSAAARWRAHNAEPAGFSKRVGFHPRLDVSLYRSMTAVLDWLSNTSGAGRAARATYACFEPFGTDPFEYARATQWVPRGNCEAPSSTC
ncbi:erythromycin esterase family protein [Pseudonocardia sp. MCCB 268]|nr:erythromycin esterase family protein [Pseudonocardia cytotoxica]